MPQTLSSTFTCDRDGTVSDPVTGTNPPMGWARVLDERTQSAGGTVKTTSLVLCPTCAGQFDTWMDALRTKPAPKD
jgi:hypothetical protein